jgi:PIN domain nuclease of toxin-antitoxin system
MISINYVGKTQRAMPDPPLSFTNRHLSRGASLAFWGTLPRRRNGGHRRTPQPARRNLLQKARDTTLLFSVASVWEVVIKNGLGRSDSQVDAQHLRQRLLLHGCTELAITGEHALAVRALPSLQENLFDGILPPQAQIEGFSLLTVDRDL